MSWFLAPSLVQLRDETDARWPDRDKASDGAVGDASHAARYSSHNPQWSAPGKWSGVVRAIDTDSNGDPGVKTPLVAALLEACIGDPRVWYVIWNRVIYSATYGWIANRYTGDNAHDHHVHVSVLETIEAWSDFSTWFDPQKRRIKPVPVHLANVRRQFLIAVGAEDGRLEFTNGVGRIQRNLNREYEAGLDVDGYVGAATVDAWRRHEKKLGGTGRAGVPDKQSLGALAAGNFRVVA